MRQTDPRAILAAITLSAAFFGLGGCQASARDSSQAAVVAATTPDSGAASGATSPVVASPAQNSPPQLPEDGLPILVNPRPQGSFEHDPTSFTQGLLYSDGSLYESTGRNGESKVRRLNSKDGKVEASQDISAEFFGEGLASLEGRLYQLTWTSSVCLIYDQKSLKPQGQLFYTSEGWGLTVSPKDKLFVFSDGSPELRFLDPESMTADRRVTVVDGKGVPVAQLNELEWVRGEVWANVWLTDRIARIDPKTGKVVGWILMSDLEAENHTGEEDVLNGIAYDPASDTLWLTGKLWSKIYRFDSVEKVFFGEKLGAKAKSK